MSEMFLVSEDRLAQLKSTRSGRISYAGYNYQCAYAVSRLASMVTSRPLFGLTDYPRHLRYDWGEDLDEVLVDDSVCFTQCKRVDDIGQPAKLADVLLGFAPKWLWTPLNSRDRVHFRLVSCDPRFRSDFTPENTREDVLDQFKKLLSAEPRSKSDRILWQNDADTIGPEQLFNALWDKLSFVYIDSTVDANDPAGVVLWSEAAARDLLLKWGFATASTQKAAIVDLRCVINESVIAFDPINDSCPSLPNRAPIRIDAADVRYALSDKKERHRSPAFSVIDRVLLSKTRVQPKEKFLFESPEWRHVVHGTDTEIKFVERDQTDALREKVLESLIKPLQSGTSNLPVLFVTGPPGSGKSTLVRRVAVTLVESGEVVVADAGLNLASGPTDLRSYTEDLQELSGAGRPVLLVLDDPLFEESGWIDLLVNLKQPGFRVAAIAATPDFLYQRYRSRLSKLSRDEFRVAPPSRNEKERFAEVYNRDIKTLGEDSDDFLIMVAEAESGEQFSKIVERVWQTLNSGLPFDDNLSFKDLPWEVRSFWFVCFLHRNYALCPLANLKVALELSGGTGMTITVEAALAKLKAQSGWSIFRHHRSSVSDWGYEGGFISTAHQQIASEAWKQRPMKWFDSEVDKILAQSTVKEPKSIRNVAIAAATMAKTDAASQGAFARELIEHWRKATTGSQRLETRDLSNFVGTLMINGGRNLVAPMREALQAKATGKDGWLAAIELWFMSSDDVGSRFFPEEIDLRALIAVADFSLAPRRAVHFFRQAEKRSDLRKAVYHRLFASLEGQLDWEIDSQLLCWLLSHAPKAENANRLSHVVHWLRCHEDNSDVRTQYLTFLQRLPAAFDEQREQAAADTLEWLARHDDNSQVRTQYLTFLQGLPAAFDEQREQAATDTLEWLARHDDNSYVRTQYLTFLQGLPAAFDEQRKQAAADTLEWLARHDDNSEVRTKYLTFLQGLPEAFDEQRKQAAADTLEWLARHDNNSEVRTKYLTFLQGLPEAFDEQRKQAAVDTLEWLARHDDNSYVRTQYLTFLQGLPGTFDEQRKQAAVDTLEWLARHDDISDVRTQYLTLVNSLPDGFDKERINAAQATSDWLELHPESLDVLGRYISFLVDVQLVDLEPLRQASDKHHQMLIAKNPANLGHYCVYGEHLLRLSRFDAAIAQFDFVLNRHKGHQMARRGRAFAIQKLGRMPEAEAEFKYALWWARIHKQSEAIFHTSLGEFYLETNKWPDAINSFQSAQKEFPDHFRNHWGIAKAQLGLGNLDPAEDALQCALQDSKLKPPTKDEIIQLLDQVRLRRST